MDDDRLRSRVHDALDAVAVDPDLAAEVFDALPVRRRAYERRLVIAASVGVLFLLVAAGAAIAVAARVGSNPSRVRVNDVPTSTDAPTSAASSTSPPPASVPVVVQPAPTTAAPATVPLTSIPVPVPTIPPTSSVFFGNEKDPAIRTARWTADASGVHRDGWQLYRRWVPYRPGPPILVRTTEAWAAVVVDADQRTLNVAWVGGSGQGASVDYGCGEFDHVGVQEQAARVVVTVYEGATFTARTKPNAVCPTVGVNKSAIVVLSQPLGGRLVVDGSVVP